MHVRERIYIYPEKLPGNEYLINNIGIWEKMGYEVLSWKKNFFKFILPTRWNKDIIILNFYEEMPLFKPYYIKFGFAILTLLLMKLFNRKIIWVRHNYKPHDKSTSWKYEVIINLLNRLVDKKVAHRNVENLSIDEVITHPLYKVSLRRDENSLVKDRLNFIYFGVVKDYKGIPELVNKWPKDIELNLYGKCFDESLKEELIRSLSIKNNISWTNDFLDSKELEENIINSDYVIIPHVDKSMIVSGAFYHALSLGANVIIKESEFALWCKKEYPFIKIYNDDNLQSVLLDAEKTNHAYIRNFVEEKNSDKKISNEWAKVFN